MEKPVLVSLHPLSLSFSVVRPLIALPLDGTLVPVPLVSVQMMAIKSVLLKQKMQHLPLIRRLKFNKNMLIYKILIGKMSLKF